MKRHFHRGISRCHSFCALGLLPLEPRRLLSIFYVDADAPGPEHDGLSWETAYTDLQDILPKASAGSRILVADGTYKPTQDADRTKSFVLRSGITLEGGYAGASDPSAERDISRYETILSGDIGDVGNDQDNTNNIVVANLTDATTVLDGVTITLARGNGMRITTANPAIRNVTFLKNQGGGAVYISNSSPTFESSIFRDNSGSFLGGAVYSQASALKLLKCLFSDNSADSGGAIYAQASALTITDSAFNDNSATWGGAIRISSTGPSAMTITNTTFQRNTAQEAGAIYYMADDSAASSLNVADSTFESNFAARFGGAILVRYVRTVTVSNSNFIANAVRGMRDGAGGAVYIQSSNAVLSDSVFRENSGDIGGALWMNRGTVTVVNAVFTSNSAVADGGTIYNANASLTVNSSKFDRNIAYGRGGALLAESGSNVLTGSLFSHNSAGTGGSIYASGSFIIADSIFAANSATGSGGAIYNNFQTVQITNGVLTANSAPVDGGAIYNAGAVTATNTVFAANKARTGGALYGPIGTTYRITLANSVLWQNQAADGPGIHEAGGTVKVTYSDVQGGWTGDGNISSDPQFVRNPDPGLDGVWNSYDDDFGDLHLQPDSPCIDAGSNAAVPADLTTDFDGNPRIADVFGVRDPGPIVDMGAYELTPVPLTLSGTNGDDHFHLRLSTDTPLLEIWNSSPPAGDPAWSLEPHTLSTLTFTGPGEDTLFLELGGATLHNPILFDSDSLTLDAPSGSSLHLSDISIVHKLKLAPTRKLTLIVRRLNLLQDSRLDIGDNAVIVQDGDYWRLFNWLKSARAGSPRWTGPGIGTSAANADQGLAIQQIGPDVKIQFTWNGDLNLDGRVNADDYFFIDQGFLQKPQPPTYHDGDFNFDGKIDADDYFLIDQAFLNQSATLSSPKPTLSTAATTRAPRSALFSRKKLSHRAHRAHRA